MPDYSTLALGFGIYTIVYSLLFLGSLPLIAHRHAAGENISPMLWRIVWVCFLLSLLLVLLGFWFVLNFF